MKDAHHKEWPGAVQELAAMLVSGQPKKLWYRDEELNFHVVTIKRNKDGYRIELNQKKVTAVIFTRNESDTIELSFYSKG